MSILSNIPNGKLPSVIDAVKGWNSSHSDGKLTDGQLGEICRGVQDIVKLMALWGYRMIIRYLLCQKIIVTVLFLKQMEIYQL